MLLVWDMYEIRCDVVQLHGVKLRGRVRKFALEQEITCLVENATDEENVVRFGLLNNADPEPISNFVRTLVPEASIREILKAVPNPVLSKLKVNDLSRYEI